MKDPPSDAFRYEFARATETANVKEKLKALTAQRNLLFERFLKNPTDIHLALEIKLIDDQVAECREQMRRETKGRR